MAGLQAGSSQVTQLGPQGGRDLRHHLTGTVGIFGENRNSVILEIKIRENGFTAPGILLHEIDFQLLRKFKKITFSHLAAVYKREVENHIFEFVAICRGLKFSLGKTKE